MKNVRNENNRMRQVERTGNERINAFAHSFSTFPTFPTFITLKKPSFGGVFLFMHLLFL
jgi:hypothetical protein